MKIADPLEIVDPDGIETFEIGRSAYGKPMLKDRFNSQYVKSGTFFSTKHHIYETICWNCCYCRCPSQILTRGNTFIARKKEHNHSSLF